ncbi:MAG: outer membrane lipoprotein-sorting protein [bacterium]
MIGKFSKILSLAAVAAILVDIAWGADLTAKQVVEKEDEVNRSRDSTYEVTMTLINKQGQERVRKLRMISKDDVEGNARTLIRFLAPADVEGTGLLTIEHRDADDDQWLYLPALRKIRRIASKEKTGSFMGSDFAYSDLGSRKIDDFNYKMLEPESIDGRECYVVEATPVSEKVREERGYSKVISWIDKERFIALQVKFYDRSGRYLKVLRASNVEKIDGKVWRARRLEMENIQEEHKTVMTFDEIALDTNPPEDTFTQRYLQRGR